MESFVSNWAQPNSDKITSKSQNFESPYKTRRDLAWEEKRRRREIYNKELFGSNEISNHNFVSSNPFYDNTFINNSTLDLSRIKNKQIDENGQKEMKWNDNKHALANKDKELDNQEKKDQFVQTSNKFYENEDKTDNKLYLKDKTLQKSNVFQPAKLYEENHDHQYLNKIKQDYRTYVREDLSKNKSNFLSPNINIQRDKNNKDEWAFISPNVNLQRENRYKNDKLNEESKQNSNFFSLNSRDKSAKKIYAEELDLIVQQKKEQKEIEKQKNRILEMKLLKENLQKSPFGRPGGGAPNHDIKDKFLNNSRSFHQSQLAYNIRPPSNIYSSFLNYGASQQNRNPNDSNKNFNKSKNKFERLDDQRPLENFIDDNNENIFEDEFVNQNQNLEQDNVNRNKPKNNPPSLSYNNFPPVPKVLDIEAIEQDLLKKTEYANKYASFPERLYGENVNDLKNMNRQYIQQYNELLRNRNLKERMAMQEALKEKLELQQKEREYLVQLENERKKQEMELITRQRQDLLDKYKQDIESKKQEIDDLKKSRNADFSEPPPKDLSSHKRKDSDEERLEQERLMQETIKKKEEEKRYALNQQKEEYEGRLKNYNDHLYQVKNELYAQQNILANELNRLKNDALIASELREKSNRELENMREKLKEQELMDEIRRIELNKAIIKTTPFPKINYKLQPEYYNVTKNYSDLLNKYDANSLVQRTNWVSLIEPEKNAKKDYFKNVVLENNDPGYNAEIFKKKTLFVDYYKDYPKKEDIDINAASIYKINDRRLSELEKVEVHEGVDVQKRIDNLIYEMNKI